MLPDYPNFLLFLIASISLALIPGTDVLYIASQSMIDRRHGILAAMGISTGIGIYILLTTFGLAEIMDRSPLIFNLAKWIGAGYLFYLAGRLFFQKESSLALKKPKTTSERSTFYKGIYTTLLNPKLGLFFITFLPQFVSPGRGKIWLQLLSLGLCFILSGTIINLIYACLFTQLREKLFKKFSIQKWLDKLTSFVFFVIAVKILTVKQYL